MTEPIQFNDGAAYERYMGQWSQLAGGRFLDWLAPESGLRWLDIGCGSGAFTEKIVERYAPASLHGIDPSAEQLAFARARPTLQSVEFHQADAMSLPFPDNSCDVAVMPLVIFFVPHPAIGVAEMVRVVSAKGTVAAYAWDMLGGGFPYEAVRAELQAMGVDVPTAPSTDVSRLDALQELWAAAGLEAVETRTITVQRTFADFEDYWESIRLGPSVGAKLAAMSADDREVLHTRLRKLLTADHAGPITYSAWANAVKGRVPVEKGARSALSRT